MNTYMDPFYMSCSMGDIALLSCFRAGRYDAESAINALVERGLHPTRPALEGGDRFSPMMVFSYATDARRIMEHCGEECGQFDHQGVMDRGQEIFDEACRQAEERNQRRKKGKKRK